MDVTMTFTAAAKAHLDELTRDQDASLTVQSAAALASVHQLFASYCGGDDILLTGITRAQASEFLAAVSTLDPTWGRSHKRSDNFTLRELLEQHGDGQGHGGLSNRTLNRYTRTLAAVWRYAEKRGHFTGANPFAGQMRRAASNRDTGYSPFTLDELRKLLGACQPVIAPEQHTVNTALDWITWIAAYSGMRLNEICSLTVEDVKGQDGVTYFNIVNAKTAAGDRRVPVHSVLIDLGLLEYWQRQQAEAAVWAKRQWRRRGSAGAKKLAESRQAAHMLWPALHEGGPDGKHSLYATKLFTKLRRELGLTREHLAFHSLRCNVATALERAGILETEAVELLGHHKLSMSYGLYSAGLDLQGLRRVVEAIQYPDVMKTA